MYTTQNRLQKGQPCVTIITPLLPVSGTGIPRHLRLILCAYCLSSRIIHGHPRPRCHASSLPVLCFYSVRSPLLSPCHRICTLPTLIHNLACPICFMRSSPYTDLSSSPVSDLPNLNYLAVLVRDVFLSQGHWNKLRNTLEYPLYGMLIQKAYRSKCGVDESHKRCLMKTEFPRQVSQARIRQLQILSAGRLYWCSRRLTLSYSRQGMTFSKIPSKLPEITLCRTDCQLLVTN